LQKVVPHVFSVLIIFQSAFVFPETYPSFERMKKPNLAAARIIERVFKTLIRAFAN
jgi:hypothetical protein